MPVTSSIHNVVARDSEEYPDSLRMVLGLVTFNEVPKVVGSASFNQHKYPGDVDVFEKVTVHESRKNAIAFFAKTFSTIACELDMTDRQVILMDFKAGLDPEFEYDIDEKTPGSTRIKIANSLFSHGYINHVELCASVYMGWMEFKEWLRNHHVIRWSMDELIAGEKVLSGRRVITLECAVEMDSLVKMDVVSYIQGRIQSVETLYSLGYDEGDGRIELQDSGNLTERLRDDVKKYSSGENYNPLKMMKRLWSLSRFIGCESIITTLNPLFKSDIAAMSQVLADIEVIRDLTLKFDNPPIRVMLLEAMEFRKRISNHISNDEFNTMDPLLGSICTIWKQWKRREMFNKKELLEVLRKIERILKKKVIEGSEKFLAEAIEQTDSFSCAS